MMSIYQTLVLRVQDELEALARSVERIQSGWQTAKRTQVDQDVYIDSVALNLHGFYSGLERLLEALAQQLDGTLPKGEMWHRDLLEQVTQDLPGIRPAVISRDSSQRLDEYRRFRHLVRNIYADRLDPHRMGDLVAKLQPLWPQLKAELVRFAEFLEGVSRTNDSSH